jgi:hypothetical protein
MTNKNPTKWEPPNSRSAADTYLTHESLEKTVYKAFALKLIMS